VRLANGEGPGLRLERTIKRLQALSCFEWRQEGAAALRWTCANANVDGGPRGRTGPTTSIETFDPPIEIFSDKISMADRCLLPPGTAVRTRRFGRKLRSSRPTRKGETVRVPRVRIWGKQNSITRISNLEEGSAGGTLTVQSHQWNREHQRRGKGAACVCTVGHIDTRSSSRLQKWTVVHAVPSEGSIKSPLVD